MDPYIRNYLLERRRREEERTNAQWEAMETERREREELKERAEYEREKREETEKEIEIHRILEEQRWNRRKEEQRRQAEDRIEAQCAQQRAAMEVSLLRGHLPVPNPAWETVGESMSVAAHVQAWCAQHPCTPVADLKQFLQTFLRSYVTQVIRPPPGRRHEFGGVGVLKTTTKQFRKTLYNEIVSDLGLDIPLRDVRKSWKPWKKN